MTSPLNSSLPSNSAQCAPERGVFSQVNIKNEQLLDDEDDAEFEGLPEEEDELDDDDDDEDEGDLRELPQRCILVY